MQVSKEMQVRKVLSGVAVSDVERAERWYETLFGWPADAAPMPGLVEWHTPGAVVQLVADRQRAGGSLLTVWVADAHETLEDLAARGGPSAELDEVTSDKVLFAILTDPDGNEISIVEVRAGVDLGPHPKERT
jgi:predicted enzyme related to lactoylglutathione lyase